MNRHGKKESKCWQAKLQRRPSAQARRLRGHTPPRMPPPSNRCSIPRRQARPRLTRIRFRLTTTSSFIGCQQRQPRCGSAEARRAAAKGDRLPRVPLVSQRSRATTTSRCRQIRCSRFGSSKRPRTNATLSGKNGGNAYVSILLQPPTPIPTGQIPPTRACYGSCSPLTQSCSWSRSARGVAAGSASLQADARDFLGDAGNYIISLALLAMALRYQAMAALAKQQTNGLSFAKVGEISPKSGLFAEHESDRVALAIVELLINAKFPSPSLLTRGLPTPDQSLLQLPSRPVSAEPEPPCRGVRSQRGSTTAPPILYRPAAGRLRF